MNGRSQLGLLNLLSSRGRLSRRRFLQLAMMLTVAGCAPRRQGTDLEPLTWGTAAPGASPTPTPTGQATPVPAEPMAAEASAEPSPEATDPAPTATPRHDVALERANSYDPNTIAQSMQALLEHLGVGDSVSVGPRVAIKVNLTGGNHFSAPAGTTAVESYVTHPEVVRALGGLLRDAGATELYIVEATFDADSYQRYGYVDVAQWLGATLLDLNDPYPYGDFVSYAVPGGGMVYSSLWLNGLLRDVDTFVSVAKLKCHCEAGVTLTLKNMVGLLPVQHYRLQGDHWWRSAIHGENADVTRTRLPRVIVDLNGARPIDLAVIDGVMAGQGGEVPRGAFMPVAPGLLVAGTDPVATDVVATTAMGFDPAADYPAVPFLRADNHLRLAGAAGLGSCRLAEISVGGVPLQDIQFPFAPCWEWGWRMHQGAFC